jgi:ABC-type Na+ efflux pump permease subunit
MWNFLTALFVGSAVGSTRTAQRLVKPLLMLCALGVVLAGVVYASIVFKAVNERSRVPNVRSHSTH